MTSQANPIPMIDSHCHLDMLGLADNDDGIDALLTRARADGVSQFLAIITDPDDAQKTIDISRAHDDVIYALGVHPLKSRETELERQALIDAIDAFEPVAVGEIGLDFVEHRGQPPRVPIDVQRERFACHLQVARESELPVIIHTRGAKEETLELLERYIDPAVGGVLHCFTDDLDMARRAIAMGFYISLSGIVTFNQAENVRELARVLPLDRLLIETDSPYLAPVPYRGKTNEPAYVVEVARTIADVRGISLDEVAMQTTANFYHLFKRAAPKMPQRIQSQLGQLNAAFRG
ncbi:TatD family hydrolase [Larsenimonas suaedae]|uniref:TatD family hydrolase n=1 Tax=Larsenimonas suaedae TaxID=1851019 RepID=A0ABU1GV24_9GAMM|nr:TatD family hydrolase [Larsenimonas suaedae]MCM2971130.1 TatD family hydrolase [Larsenimonas suaedae]MDR5895839.1 TatD family hydrolase [Larsenimonas suaedae]